MKKPFFSSLFFFIFAIYLMIASHGFGLGVWSRPGPGLYPFCAALLLGVISLGVMVKALLTFSAKGKEATPDLPSRERVRWEILVKVMAGMIAYSLLLKWIGFVICTFLLVAFFLRVVAKERLTTALVAALLTSVGYELFFNVFLNAQIPSGLLTFLRR
jgi:putative tricarboxylic transport membrane protein